MYSKWINNPQFYKQLHLKKLINLCLVVWKFVNITNIIICESIKVSNEINYKLLNYKKVINEKRVVNEIYNNILITQKQVMNEWIISDISV